MLVVPGMPERDGNENEMDKNNPELLKFLANSHEFLIGLVPLNPEISKTDEWRDPIYDSE